MGEIQCPPPNIVLYAALKTEVVVVRGHSKCGAVGGAVECTGESSASCLDQLLNSISDDLGCEKDVEQAILRNLQKNVSRMQARSSIIKDAVSQGGKTKWTNFFHGVLMLGFLLRRLGHTLGNRRHHV